MCWSSIGKRGIYRSLSRRHGAGGTSVKLVLPLKCHLVFFFSPHSLFRLFPLHLSIPPTPTPGVLTQGGGVFDTYVSSYYLQFSQSGSQWYTYRELITDARPRAKVIMITVR